MAQFIDLTGQIFGRLTVEKRVENNKWGSSMWLCRCSCTGKEKIFAGKDLLKGDIISCGCFRSECASKRLKKYNKYLEVDSETIAIYSSNSDGLVIIDKDDFEKIKSYCWSIDNNGYVVAHEPKINKYLSIARLIEGLPDPLLDVDHIDRNKLNNKKNNLRVVTSQQNTLNRGLYSTNTSGISGVQETKYHTWIAKLDYRRKRVFCKTFKTKEEAIVARLNAEKKYLPDGEAPQRHLFKEYGIV